MWAGCLLGGQESGSCVGRQAGSAARVGNGNPRELTEGDGPGRAGCITLAVVRHLLPAARRSRPAPRRLSLAARCLLLAACCLPPACRSLSAACRLLLASHRPPHNARCPPPPACSLPVACRLPPAARRPLLPRRDLSNLRPDAQIWGPENGPPLILKISTRTPLIPSPTATTDPKGHCKNKIGPAGLRQLLEHSHGRPRSGERGQEMPTY